MQIRRYSPSDAAQWDGFVAQARNGLFLFYRQFMDYHADRFTDHSLMVYDEQEALVAVLPANEASGVLYSHQGLTFGGFVTSTTMRAAKMLAIFDALKLYAAQHGLHKMVYKAIPYSYTTYPAQEDLYALFRHQATLVRVDITSTIAIANKLEFAELRKRGVKKALKAGVTCARSDDYAAFMALLRDVLQARHETLPVHSTEEITLLASRFPEQIALHVATRDGELLAGVIVFMYANLVHAQYIAASPAGRDCGALDALFASLIGTTYAQHSYFDFGISTEAAGTVLNEGLAAQKEGFGGRGIAHQFYELHWH